MKTSMLRLNNISLLIFFLSFSLQVHSQVDSLDEIIKYEDVQTLFQKLGTYDKMVVKTDLDSLQINKRTSDDQPATILFYGENQPILRFKTKIKARGKYRRVKCDIPPLKLNFSKSELSDMGLYRNFDKLKLVTHCFLDGKLNDVVLKEHWVYKMYNSVSDYSFNVKLFQIVYVDNKDANRKWEGEGFFLEPNAEMAFRNQGEIVDSFAVKNTDVTTDSYHHLLMFNYMVGNTDWDISKQKNMKFLRCSKNKRLIIVPYDFDNCKLVDAPYMSLYPDAKEVKLDNRYVKKKFSSKEGLYEKMALFKMLGEESKLHCYMKCERLNRIEKLKMKGYLKPFFKSLKKKKKIEKLLLE